MIKNGNIINHLKANLNFSLYRLIIIRKILELILANSLLFLDRENALHLFLRGLNLPTNFIGRLEKVKTEMTMEELRNQMP